MELIRRAIERAQNGTVAPIVPASRPASNMPPRPASAPVNTAEGAPHDEVVLQRETLESYRIVAHDVANPLRKSFDILRTHVLQTMDEKDFHVLAVTSPSPGCGKTVTAINLALSIARQPERSVLLIDMDLQRPRVANYLGIDVKKGVLGVLEGQLSIPDATICTRIGSLRFSAMLAEGAAQDSSKWMASRSMSNFLKEIRRTYRSHVVIIDLPPMLTSDDVLAILPEVDCALFVAAVGVSTTAEIEDCIRHLQSTELVRMVLNKASDNAVAYAGASY